MENVLIVSGEKALAALTSLLRQCGYQNVIAVSSAGEARRKLLELSLSLIIINMPLPDESGVHFAVSCAETTSAGVLATAPAVQAGELSGRLERCGVFVLEKPLSRSSFMQAVRLLSLFAKACICSAEKRMRSFCKSWMIRGWPAVQNACWWND